MQDKLPQTKSQNEPPDRTEPPKVRFQALRSIGRALAHRNYRLFFFGQGISLIGGWMSRVATGWLVYRLAGPAPAFLLGLMSFVAQMPTFFLAPIAGVMVDRWNRRTILIATQSLFMAQSTMLTVVAFSHASGPAVLWAIGLISLLEGFINAFDMPARQAFLIEMVTRKEDLPNAIALNSSLMNGARLIGPSLAGILIALTGEGICFAFDAVSSIAIIGALLAMRVTSIPKVRSGLTVWHELRQGFVYAFGFPPIRTILLLLALISFMGMPYSVLLPIFAADILHGGSSTLGFLTGSAGVGALTGAAYLASRTSVLGLGRVIIFGACLFGAGLCGLGSTDRLPVALLCTAIAGFGMMVQMASSNTILQTIVEDRMRGRVMSFYGMAFLGMAPFGSMFAGTLAQRIGAPATVFLGGIACISGGLVFGLSLPRLRTLVRPIYIQKGIVPEIAKGVATATQLTPPQET